MITWVGVSSAPNPSSLQLLPSWWSLLPTLHLQPKVLQPIRHLWLVAALITDHRSRFSRGARTVPFKFCPTFTYPWIFRIFRWPDQTLWSFQFGQIRSKHLETFSANQVTISHLLQINCANFTISHVSLWKQGLNISPIQVPLSQTWFKKVLVQVLLGAIMRDL